MQNIIVPAVNTYNPQLSDQEQLIAIPAFSDNYIWMVCKNNYAIVVDPGDSQPVVNMLQQHGLQLSAILITHHHNDHVGGLSKLKQETNAIVYGPATENIPVCDKLVTQDDIVNIAEVGLSLRVLDIPGHTAGHIAFYGLLNNQPLVFCGDTLFAGGCGRIFEGTPAQMYKSLSKLAALSPDTLVCCAHEYTLSNLQWAITVEPDNQLLHQRLTDTIEMRNQGITTLPSTINTELQTNPFLRTQYPSIVNAASTYADKPLTDPVDILACLREWKNNS